MSSDVFALYGTSFAGLEDEERDPVSKRPTALQDQVATDERGRRRFHGAFTGGFSAGYFNSVGSKHGWAPAEFRSSRDDRADKTRRRAEDFMDSEDLGEFGISSRRIRQTKDFTSGNQLAWERDSRKGMGTEGVLSRELETVVRPVSDSIGVRMLRVMGWRQGRAVGLATIKEAKASRNLADVDREQITKVAPHWVASTEDEEVIRMEAAEGKKGLGYDGQLKGEGLLNERFGQRVSALIGKKGKGITGQAFGVGAFEDEDESVYTSYDLTQYDFSLGPAMNEKKLVVPDCTFVTASNRLAPRTFFSAPKLPPNFKPEHRPRPMDRSLLPKGIQEVAASMTALQRSLFLGENRNELIVKANEGRRKKSRWDVKAEEMGEDWEGKEERERRQRHMDREAHRAKRVEFPDEPMKQERFTQFLNYIRRGIVMPQPHDLSHWEWETEQSEFEGRLLPDERALLPDVKARTKPLAKSALALPIMDMLRSKFVGETNKATSKSTKDEDRMMAVKSQIFGERTRNKWEWHPSHALVKLFNVPNPYPGSGYTGLPHLQGKGKRKDDMMTSIGLPSTAAEFALRAGIGEERNDNREERREYKEKRRERKEKDEREEDDDYDEKENQMDEIRPPEIFFSSIFVIPSSSESEGEEEEEDKMKGPAAQSTSYGQQEEGIKTDEQQKGKVLGIMDIDDEYGPLPPPGIGEKAAITGFSTLRFNDVVLKKMRKRKHKEEEEEKNKKKSKKRKKEKKSKKEKKEKKKKDRKRRRSTSTLSSDSDSSVQAID